jgi:hypothetical protein
MTLMVFLGILVSLLVLRSIPDLLLRLMMAIPRHHLIAMMTWMHGRKVGIVLPRKSTAALSNALIASSAPAGRFKLALVSSSLLVLAVLVTTVFLTWHSTGLMMLLR